jgi:hypothetical protein
MALTRARFDAGDASLGAALAKTVRKTLTGERGAAAIAQATRAMRGLIASCPWAMGHFIMMSDRRRLSRMVRRRDRALSVNRRDELTPIPVYHFNSLSRRSAFGPRAE